MRTILLEPQDLQLIVPTDCVANILSETITRFNEQFEKLPGRVPFHISALVFPYRVPIYLVLEAARRLKEMALSTELKEVVLERNDNSFFCTRRLDDRYFESKYPIDYTLEGGEGRLPEGTPPEANDQFFSNLEIISEGDSGTRWKFIGDLPENEQIRAKMILNRLCLAEIGGGLVLNEIGLPSEILPSFKAHDVPLEHWYELFELIRVEKNIKQKQKRSLRSVVTKREIFWDRNDSVVREILIPSCEMLWCEKERLGKEQWQRLDDREKRRLVNACLNGGIFMASFIEEKLGYASQPKK